MSASGPSRQSRRSAACLKSAGRSHAEVSAAFDRELSLWLTKGPRQIIAEFDEQMKTEAHRLLADT
jgi:hypothetical protein